MTKRSAADLNNKYNEGKRNVKRYVVEERSIGKRE